MINRAIKIGIVFQFLNDLGKMLMIETEKCPDNCTKQQVLWFLKDKTTKFAWYSMAEKKCSSYSKYKKEFKDL